MLLNYLSYKMSLFNFFLEKRKNDKYKRMKQDDSKIGTSKMKGKVTPFTGWLRFTCLKNKTVLNYFRF